MIFDLIAIKRMSVGFCPSSSLFISTFPTSIVIVPVMSYRLCYLYLDPMFPPQKKKSSAVKKDMSILRSLLGTADMSNIDTSAEHHRMKEERDLLIAACNLARRSVVVKRPIGSLPLGHLITNDMDQSVITPSYDVRGSLNHWDVYVLS